MLTGEAKNLKNDVSFDEKNYRLVHKSMVNRAKKNAKPVHLVWPSRLDFFKVSKRASDRV